MTEKRFSIKGGSSIGLSSIYTDNGKVMTQLEVLDVLIKQHETIQTLAKENEQLKKELDKLKVVNEMLSMDFTQSEHELLKENEQLKKELKVYRNLANCSNCKYQNYNWFEDGDEFEICEKGNNEQKMEYHICKEWEEFE